MILPKNYPFQIPSSFGTIDFVDLIHLHGITEKDITVDLVVSRFFKIEIPFFEFLLKLRNLLMRPFGLLGTKNEIIGVYDKLPYTVGDKASLFTVESRTDTEIVLAEKDKHLNFRIYNVLLCKPDGSYSYYCSTVVHYNNVFGKIYFFFVRPVHCFMLKLMQQKAQRSIDRNL